MREIESIKKITVTTKFEGGPETYSTSFQVFISSITILPIDEIVIRNVKWNANPDGKCYLLWSNITNNFFRVLSASSTLPDLRSPIVIQTLPPDNVIEFRVFRARSIGEDRAHFNHSVQGEIDIDLEFISYKKNH